MKDKSDKSQDIGSGRKMKTMAEKMTWKGERQNMKDKEFSTNPGQMDQK